MKNIEKKIPLFEHIANVVTRVAGSSLAFTLAVLVIIAWAATGPVFKYSDTWQLVINTSTTIITFLMVFIIQKSQNKEAKSTQLKLNELIAAMEKASNLLVNVEDLTEEEMNTLKTHYKKLASLTRSRQKVRESHSVEEAIKITEEKLGKQKNK
jgi:low affinity Fe/Cu permease